MKVAVVITAVAFIDTQTINGLPHHEEADELETFKDSIGSDKASLLQFMDDIANTEFSINVSKIEIL